MWKKFALLSRLPLINCPTMNTPFLTQRWADLRTFVHDLLARRWVRFGLVGGAATLCYGLLGLFFVTVCALPALLGNALAYAISFIVSYCGQCLWTFRAGGTDGHRVMLPRFAATQGIGLGCNSLIIWLLMTAGMRYETAMPIAILLVPVMVYTLCKYWVFRSAALGKKNAVCGEVSRTK